MGAAGAAVTAARVYEQAKLGFPFLGSFIPWQDGIGGELGSIYAEERRMNEG